jgi:hypothetical protein
MHLLCGQCQHQFEDNCLKNLPSDILEINEELIDRCPHAAAVLSKFAMLHKSGNQCDEPIKRIFTSQYCLPLRIILFNYLLENDSSFELKLDELFNYFPSRSISVYSNYLKRVIHNHNLNQALLSVLRNQRNDNDPSNIHTIEFLLRQGARIDKMSDVHCIITYLLLTGHSEIPFMLLDYSLYVDINFEQWLSRNTPRMNLYICRVIQCGYPNEFRTKFEDFKSYLTQQTVNLVEEFIDLKNPQSLSKLCLQKLRGSLKNLGDETKEQLKDYVPDRLRSSITRLGYDECGKYYRTVAPRDNPYF